MYDGTSERSQLSRQSRLDESGLLRFISGCSPFRRAQPEACLDIAARATLRLLRKGEIVVSQDSPNDTLFVVRRGLVKLVIYGEDGRAITIAKIHPGQFFGGTSVVDAGPSDATAVAQEDLALLCLRHEELSAHFVRYPETAVSLVVALSKCIRRRTEIVARLGLQTVEARLMGTLIALADPAEVDVLGVVRNLPTHQELADIVGSRRETVSRVLSTCVRRRLVWKRGRDLVLSTRMDSTSRGATTLDRRAAGTISQ